jgi:ubiquinone/menaquinone biosynthesis C-methylase UbiE
VSQLVFDEKVAAQLEAIYRTADVMRRRRLALEALAAEPGDVVLDLGCGPGFYVADLLDVIGPEGAVTGVDPSPAMLEMTRRRVDGHANARVLEGQATALPVGDGEFDRLLSVQVFEYLDDVSAALAEVRRVLKPGGRLVLWDIDWSTLSWHSTDPERMERTLRAWDRHLANPVLPRTLAATLRGAGFTDVERAAHVFATTTMDPETFGGALSLIVRQYLAGLEDLDQKVADAWLAELGELQDRGEYSASLTQFCFTATRGR